MKILILGIGNSILKDDGIGPAVIRELQQYKPHPGVTLKDTNLSGMPLLDILSGYDTLIVVDAIQSGGKPGEVRWLQPRDLETDVYPSSQHKMNIFRMLEIGKRLGLDLPRDIRIMAIEANDVTSFGEELTADVAAVIPKAGKLIMKQVASMPGYHRQGNKKYAKSGEYHVENE